MLALRLYIDDLVAITKMMEIQEKNPTDMGPTVSKQTDGTSNSQGDTVCRSLSAARTPDAVVLCDPAP